MIHFYLFETGYAIIAFACGYYTFAEGENSRSHWDRSRVLGLMMCVFWPVLVLVLLAPGLTQPRRTP